jgi:hypothetical protein
MDWSLADYHPKQAELFPRQEGTLSSDDSQTRLPRGGHAELPSDSECDYSADGVSCEGARVATVRRA